MDRHDGLIGLARLYWPGIRFYPKQLEMIHSVQRVKETVVVAGNQLGKDFTAGFITLAFFLWPQFFFPEEYVDEVEARRKPGMPDYLVHTRRVVTTSVREKHLDVLWGEIGKYLTLSEMPLLESRGGPLVVNALDVRFREEREVKKPFNYLIGCVAGETGEGLAGHHAAYNLFVADEASGLSDTCHTMAQGWARRFLEFGNPHHCENFFRKAVKEGDQPHRKVIRITAEDSPNVQARREIYPGVLTWPEYQERRATWDPIRQCIGLDAQFYEGPGQLLFPPLWLNHAAGVADSLGGKRRIAKAMGVDPGEGSAETAWVIGDELGLMKLLALKTPNTNDVPNITIGLMKEWNIDPIRVAFDRGGGGKQHADQLRERGYPVRTVGFGTMLSDPKRGKSQFKERREESEQRTTYTDRRAQMYGEASLFFDPSVNETGYGLPREYAELRRQLAVHPKLYDRFGVMYLPPKTRKPHQSKTREQTITEVLGCSPDQADAFVLMVHAMVHLPIRRTAGVL